MRPSFSVSIRSPLRAPQSLSAETTTEAKQKMSDKRTRLLQLLNELSLTVGEDFTLSTGQRSDFYFDCKKVTLNGEGLSLMADLMLDKIASLPVIPVSIGGLTMGADFITAAVIMRAHERGLPTVHGSIVRQSRKAHGTKNKVENRLAEGTPSVVIDDVVTSGSSTLTACEAFEEAGYQIIGVIALVDREAGGLQKISEIYQRVYALFSASEFPKLIAHRDAGPKRAVGR